MAKLTLYVFGPAFGLPDMSPFVVKTMVLLKMAQLDFKTIRGGFRHAPKGKLPYLRDGEEIICDSTFIRWHLAQKYQIDFDAHLSAAERGIAWAFEKMIEEHLYWAVLRERWLKEHNYRKGPWQFFQRLGWPLRTLVPFLARRSMASKVAAQGMGLHSDEEVLCLVKKAIDSLSDFLADKPYLMGEQLCATDATVFAFIQSGSASFFAGDMQAYVAGKKNLAAYIARMNAQFFA